MDNTNFVQDMPFCEFIKTFQTSSEKSICEALEQYLDFIPDEIEIVDKIEYIGTFFLLISFQKFKLFSLN